MIGGVTRRMLPHLSGVPHLHVNRPLTKVEYNEKMQPRPQGFSLKKWVGREKALASAGHVSILHPEILGVINLLFPPHPFFKGKALGTRLEKMLTKKQNLLRQQQQYF